MNNCQRSLNNLVRNDLEKPDIVSFEFARKVWSKYIKLNGGSTKDVKYLKGLRKYQIKENKRSV